MQLGGHLQIVDIFKKRLSFSFEVFPPKNDQPMDPLLKTLSELYRFEPDFISCTYGSGGTNKGRSKEVCESVKKSGHEILTHFTCIGNSCSDIKTIIKEYADIGLENVLAMRGDFPKGQQGTGGDFDHANKLIAFLKVAFPQVCLAAAGYPEKHILAPSFDSDIVHLRNKQDAGAEFIMLQLCHDVDAYSRFVERARKAGVTVPFVVGLMPILVKDPIIRMTIAKGCSIPKELAAIMGKYGDDPESFKKAGMEYTVEQLHRYISAGVNGIHIFTLNKHEDVSKIVLASGIRVQK
jgi:methylenetetrahydrofolate reductase (NADPH)